MNIEDKSAKEKIKKKKSQVFSDKISSEIGETISNPDEDLIKNLDSIINKSFRLISRSDLKNPQIQKEIFEQILSFLNNLFGNIDIKKFYNNIPKTYIKKYAEKSLGEQFIHNIYGKQRKLFYREEIGGGSCSYRTILLKHFFEELEKRGMKLKSDIFFFHNNDINGGRGHSGVIILFQGKEYLADFSGFNSTTGVPIIQSVDDINKKYKSNNFDCFRSKNIKKYYKLYDKKTDNPRDLLFFHDTQTFAERWAKRGRKNATIEFVPKLDGESSKEVKFEFQPSKIYLTIDDTQYIFAYKKDNKNSIDIPDERFFDYFISHIQHLQTINKSTKEIINTTGEKSTFTEYLDLIREKINIQKLRKIYKT